MVFALPGEPGLTELVGDFKVHFHDRQGDFYFWLNTTMLENRKVLNTNDLDGFDKRKLPSPGFQVEVVLVDYNGTVPTTPNTETSAKKMVESSGTTPASVDEGAAKPNENKNSKSHEKDDVFSDSEAEETGSSKSRQAETASAAGETVTNTTSSSETKTNSDQIATVTHATEHISLGNTGSTQLHVASEPKSDVAGGAISGLEVSNTESEFKAMAADASVFTFGDDEDYESE